MSQKQDGNQKRKQIFFDFYLGGDCPRKGASSLPCPLPGKTTLTRRRSEFFDCTNNSTENPNILDDSPRVQKQHPLFFTTVDHLYQNIRESCPLIVQHEKILDPFYNSFSARWIKPKTISRYCPFIHMIRSKS
jgi:hypothetical protein